MCVHMHVTPVMSVMSVTDPGIEVDGWEGDRQTSEPTLLNETMETCTSLIIRLHRQNTSGIWPQSSFWTHTQPIPNSSLWNNIAVDVCSRERIHKTDLWNVGDVLVKQAEVDHVTQRL